MSRLNRIALWLTVLVLVSFCSLLLCAQNTTQNVQSGAKTPNAGTHHQVVVTGCLKRRSEPGHYYITDQDSRTWELSSTSIDLAKEINHVVSVSGHEKVLPKSEAEELSKRKSRGRSRSVLLLLDGSGTDYAQHKLHALTSNVVEPPSGHAPLALPPPCEYRDRDGFPA